MGLFDFAKKIPSLNELTGNYGEWLTKYYSGKMTDAFILHDVLIDSKNGNTSQLDLVMVGVRGIYVVEVKTFAGARVYGDFKKSKWYYYNGANKYEIYSPVKQNEMHIKYLKSFLNEFGEIPVYSIITMICDDFKISNMSGDIENLQTAICSSLPAMTKALELFATHKPIVFDEEKQRKIYEYILNNQHQGKDARTEHKERVKEYLNSIDDMKNQKMCPYCKTPLVLRKGKFGEFYGCSKYPACRYTLKIGN